ncbi:MAG TPA: GIY-YIG nuclease family protein [Leeuwenhoekiella sp.]|nr:GIY-YIG nuclease family protein [Leeuwenhoekiella sp.]
MDKKKTLDDIFNDDEFGILDSKPTKSSVKSEDERLIESFQEINDFFIKNNRKPEATNVTEFKLLSRLKALGNDPKKIDVLKTYDTYNLLGANKEVKSVSDILQDDDLGILDTDETLSIFKLEHVPSSAERAESDFVAQRKAMKDKEFLPYESMFKKIHKELREGDRQLFAYENADKNLKAGSFYVLNGVLLYLEDLNIETENISLPSGGRLRKDGRTRIIFENGTMSNMLYRSLDKTLLNSANDGRIVSHTTSEIENELFNNVNSIKDEDKETGWIYVLKSKSSNQEIVSIQDLYKIGYSTVPVPERIKNASKEPTYLMAEVRIVEAYKTYNLNAQKFENLVHRFFGEVCLNVDITDDKGRRITPREWFVVPLPVIQKVISLILSGEIVDWRYDKSTNQLIEK